MSLPQVRTGAYVVADMTIEEILAELYSVSFPRLSCLEHSGLWYAKADMRIKVQGAEFSVASESKHPTPAGALRELLDRVRNAMKQLGAA